ncbi:MAG: hypothetical protein E3J72_18790 [Planctomycetota bacterium]|nr:MAG: hypothetical protein E3J72_18790 [Planctomycetota bacterium]
METMKHLPLKLGVGIVLLFAAVIATCLLWTPVRIMYYVGKLQSQEPKERVKGINGLFALGEKGKKAMRNTLNIDIKEIEFIEKYWTRVNDPMGDNFKFKELYPIHYAALQGYNSAIELFIFNGAEVNEFDKSGSSPMYHAVDGGKKETVKLLLGKGVDVNSRIDSNFFTPLILASALGREDIVEFLLKKGAEVNVKLRSGETSLHFACMRCNKDIAKLLIEKGADVNAKDNMCVTPLHLAADGKHEVAKLLIENGADVNAINLNKLDKTSLDIARYYKHSEIITLLRAHGGKTGEELRKEPGK